jgi:acetyl esterase
MNLRTSAERALAKVVLALPRRALVRLAGGKRIVIDDAPLDEQVQVLLAMARRLGRKGPEQLGVALARKDMAENAKVLDVEPRPARVREHSVQGGRFYVRTYVPRTLEGKRDAPALLYIHGGGFVCGDRDTHDGICRYFADEARCVVASLDYRRAPEEPFPAAVEDTVAAFAWLREHEGIDPARIAVGGDSAGGNLSAVLCQQQKLHGEPLPRFQLLIYPATDMTRSMESHRLFAKGFYLEEASIDFYLAQYLGKSDPRDPRASPLFGEVAGLPPALIFTAGFDPLRDEGAAYAEKLADAGVTVQYINDAGMFHGYFSCGLLDVAAASLAHAARSLRSALR